MHSDPTPRARGARPPALLAAPLALALSVAAAPARGQLAAFPRGESAPALADSTLHFVVTGHYELYAPDVRSLAELHRELDRAVAQFRRYVGVEPSPIAVVVFESAEQARSYDASEFDRRGVPVLPVVRQPDRHRTPSRLAAPGLPDNGGDPPASGTVGGEGARTPDGREVAFDACRLFLRSYERQRRGRPTALAPTRSLGVGADDSSTIPAWLDEGTSALCASPSDSAGRGAPENSPRPTIPLSQLLAMRIPAGNVGTGNLLAGTPVVGTSDSWREQAFSAEALSLCRFLADREGDQVIGRLVDGAIDGRGSVGVLADALGPHADVAALEREWVHWADGGRAAR